MRNNGRDGQSPLIRKSMRNSTNNQMMSAERELNQLREQIRNKKNQEYLDIQRLRHCLTQSQRIGQSFQKERDMNNSYKGLYRNQSVLDSRNINQSTNKNKISQQKYLSCQRLNINLTDKKKFDMSNRSQNKEQDSYSSNVNTYNNNNDNDHQSSSNNDADQRNQSKSNQIKVKSNIQQIILNSNSKSLNCYEFFDQDQFHQQQQQQQQQEINYLIDENYYKSQPNASEKNIFQSSITINSQPHQNNSLCFNQLQNNSNNNMNHLDFNFLNNCSNASRPVEYFSNNNFQETVSVNQEEEEEFRFYPFQKLDQQSNFGSFVVGNNSLFQQDHYSNQKNNDCGQFNNHQFSKSFLSRQQQEPEIFNFYTAREQNNKINYEQKQFQSYSNINNFIQDIDLKIDNHFEQEFAYQEEKQAKDALAANKAVSNNSQVVEQHCLTPLKYLKDTIANQHDAKIQQFYVNDRSLITSKNKISSSKRDKNYINDKENDIRWAQQQQQQIQKNDHSINKSYLMPKTPQKSINSIVKSYSKTPVIKVLSYMNQLKKYIKTETPTNKQTETQHTNNSCLQKQKGDQNKLQIEDINCILDPKSTPQRQEKKGNRKSPTKRFSNIYKKNILSKDINNIAITTDNKDYHTLITLRDEAMIPKTTRNMTPNSSRGITINSTANTPQCSHNKNTLSLHSQLTKKAGIVANNQNQGGLSTPNNEEVIIHGLLQPKSSNTNKKVQNNLQGFELKKQIPTIASSPLNKKNDLFSTPLHQKPDSQPKIFDEINLNNFKLEQEIGKGSYASVKLAIERHTQIRYALKIYPRFVLLDPHKLRNVKREITILRKLQHPNIIKMPFAFEDKSNQIIVGMEYVGKASLHSFLKQKPDRHVEEAEAKKLFSQLVEGINYCHSMNVVHRDIKLENILLDSTNNIKIIDFGFSIIIPEDKRLKIFCGTPSYMAPEIVSKIEYVGQKADIWALGILLYVMMQGKFPFKGVSDADLYKKIKKGTYTFTHPVSQSGEDIIAQMLAIKPSDRPSASQILEHEWLRI